MKEALGRERNISREGRGVTAQHYDDPVTKSPIILVDPEEERAAFFNDTAADSKLPKAHLTWKPLPFIIG